MEDEKMLKSIHKRTLSALLAVLLVLSSVLPGFGGTVVVGAASTTVDGTTVSDPQEGQAYYFDFAKNSSLASGVEGDYGLISVTGNVTPNSHGPQFGNGTSITLKLAESSKISLGYCTYDTPGTGFTVSASNGGSIGTLPTFPAKNTIDCYGTSGQMYSFEYTKVNQGEETITINFTSTYYIPYILVEPMSTLDVWAQKDFSMKIGETTFDLTGASSSKDAASVTVDQGIVYYSLAESAMVSLPLGGATLKDSMLENLSTGNVESLKVNAEGNIVVTFKDQTTSPSTFTVKVQDSDLFVTPGVKDSYGISFTAGDIPAVFSSTNPISNYYTTNNGIVSIGVGSGTSKPFFHGTSHGLAIYDGNYIDVVVAGDATVSFELCAYASGTIAASNLASNGTGSFDSDNFQGNACNDVITYTYTGDATTLRFTLSICKKQRNTYRISSCQCATSNASRSRCEQYIICDPLWTQIIIQSNRYNC